jgi:hypothetical protein
MWTFRGLTLEKAPVNGFDRPGQVGVQVSSDQPRLLEFLASVPVCSAVFAGVEQNNLGGPAPAVVVSFMSGFRNFPNTPGVVSLNPPQIQPLPKANKIASL